jgi:hypothetical protein
VGEDADKPPVALIPERAPVEIICAACVLSQHGVKVVVMLGHVDDGLGDAARRLAYFGGVPSAFQVQVRVAGWPTASVSVGRMTAAVISSDCAGGNAQFGQVSLRDSPAKTSVDQLSDAVEQCSPACRVECPMTRVGIEKIQIVRRRVRHLPFVPPELACAEQPRPVEFGVIKGNLDGRRQPKARRRRRVEAFMAGLHLGEEPSASACYVVRPDGSQVASDLQCRGSFADTNIGVNPVESGGGKYQVERLHRQWPVLESRRNYLHRRKRGQLASGDRGHLGAELNGHHPPAPSGEWDGGLSCPATDLQHPTMWTDARQLCQIVEQCQWIARTNAVV